MKSIVSLQKLREDRELSVESLAGLVGVTAPTIKNWESGFVPLEKAAFCNVVALAGALNVSIDDLWTIASHQ